MIIQSKQQHIRIAQSKILYLERIMRTTNIHTADTIYQTPEKMDSLLERLCPWFCPSHRSYIVNGRHIVNLDRHHAILSNDTSSQQNLLRKFKKDICQMYMGRWDVFYK